MGFKKIQIFQFECPRHWNPSLSLSLIKFFVVGRFTLSQYGQDWGVSVPGAFKLDHLQPFKPILFWKFSNFFTFILGSPLLLPQRANNGNKGNSAGSQYGWDWGVSVPGVAIAWLVLLSSLSLSCSNAPALRVVPVQNENLSPSSSFPFKERRFHLMKPVPNWIHFHRCGRRERRKERR